MRYILIFCQLLSLINASVYGQSYWSKKYDLDGGNDRGSDIQIFDDNSALIHVQGFCADNTRDCIGLLRINSAGQVLWKAIVYDTFETNYPEAIHVRGDTIFCNSNYIDSDTMNYSILILDMDGNYLTRHDYFHDGTQGYHYARNLTGNNDLLFVNFGYKDGTSPAREVIRAYDKSWNIAWETSVPNTFPHIRWCNTKATPDGGIVSAYTSRQNGEDFRMATIEKYDAQGDLDWQTSLPHIGEFRSDWIKIDLHPDGGYVGMWEYDTSGFHVPILPTLIFKIDGSGEIEWERLELEEQFNLQDVFVTDNGDIVGCGIAEDSYWDNTDPDFRSAYIIRLNSLGEKKWDRKILEESEGVFLHELTAGVETNDGDLFFTGEIIDTIFGTPNDPTPGNIWVLKLDSLGCLTPDCGEWQHITTATRDLKKADPPGFIVYPNPASGYLIVGASLGARIPHGEYMMSIHDMSGQMITKRHYNPYLIQQIDVGMLPDGHYVLTIWRDGLLVQTEKVVVR